MSKVIQNTANPEASPKLSDLQRKILQNASKRPDLFVVIRKGHELRSRSPVSALVRRGFLVETAVGERQPVWKRNSDGTSIGLAITPSGLQAIGREACHPASSSQRDARQLHQVGVHQDPEPATKISQDTDRDHDSSNDASGQAQSSSLRPKTDPKHHARLGSKRALVIDLLRRGDGAPLQELQAATGWLPHTTRAALTGLRKAGFVLEKSKGNEGKTLYRIVAEPTAASEADADHAQLAA